MGLANFTVYIEITHAWQRSMNAGLYGPVN